MLDLKAIPADEFNLLKEFEEMNTEVFTQQGCNCCSAIASSGAVGMTYYMQNRRLGMNYQETSPQDIMDRVWHYSSDGTGEEVSRIQDARGCYNCKSTTCYRHIEKKGIGFLKDYLFENRINENKGPIKPNEFPRITISGFEGLETTAAIFDCLRDHRAVTACVDITDAFENYKEGIYELSSDMRITGAHCVIIVGFSENGDYFRIKNSWGPGWGIGGFGQVQFNSKC